MTSVAEPQPQLLAEAEAARSRNFWLKPKPQGAATFG
jgi:hypothetical protein